MRVVSVVWRSWERFGLCWRAGTTVRKRSTKGNGDETDEENEDGDDYNSEDEY